MTTRNSIKLFHVLLFSILLFACDSGNLSRSKAEELISKSLNLPVIVPVQLGKSFAKKSWHDNWGVCLVTGDKYSDVKQGLDELQAKGLIKVGEDQQHEGECNYLWATVELTDEGKKYLIKDAGGQYELKGFDLTFGEITGIQINEQLKTAVAEYTLKRTNISPFGSKISAGSMNRKATFALFDDGWRIK